MATVIGNSNDVVTFLKSQHKQVKGLLAAVLSAEGEKRKQAFEAVRAMLAVHESAEERVVHPAARKALTNGEAIVRERLREEAGATQALAELQKLEVGSQAFEAKFRTLQANVLAHAEAEETQEFDALRTTLDPKQLASMRQEVEAAVSMVQGPPPGGSKGRDGASAEMGMNGPPKH